MSASQAGDYAVVVTNNYGSITSSNAYLAVIATPSITNQPQDLAAYCGQDAVFQVGAGGPSPLSYQWLYQGTPIAGATMLELDLAAVSNELAGAYSVAVACPCGSVTSLVASLTVLGIPLVTNPPQDAVVFCGETATFQVGATGPTPLSYQWFFKGAPINNATNPTLAIVGVTNANAGPYDVLVSCPCGSITTSVADRSINDEPPRITSPLNAAAVQGQPFTYTITGLHNPTLYTAVVMPPGLTLNPTNGVMSGTNLENGTFYVQFATGNACAQDTKTLTLVVSSGAPAITSAGSASGVAGSAFTYTITATPSPTSYSAQNLPPGLILNPLTGVISGTPAYEGVFAATISASNPWGTGSAPLAVSIGYGPVHGLSIVSLHTNYSKPFLLDFQFGLRDNNDPTAGNPLVVDPSLLSVAAYEDTNQVDSSETAFILKRVVPGSLKVEVNLVLDFSESISSITLNGDSYGDGISDAVHAEISSAELFVTEQPASTLIGVYEFHRKDLAPKKVVGLTNQTAAFNAIAGIWTNYINYDTSTSRAWDALASAIQALGKANSSQLHSVIFVSDGNDNSSSRDPPELHQRGDQRGRSGLLPRFRRRHQYQRPATTRLGQRRGALHRRHGPRAGGRFCPNRQGLLRALPPALGHAQAVGRSNLHARLFGQLRRLHRRLAHQPRHGEQLRFGHDQRGPDYDAAHDQLFHQHALDQRHELPLFLALQPGDCTRAT